MQVAFVYGTGWQSRLTRLFTQSRAYHVGFTDGVHFWDMHLLRRRRMWATYRARRECIVVTTPVPVSRDYLEYMLSTCEERYGFVDYALFALRPLYHLFGKSTRSAGGLICSEMVANDLAACGWPVRFREVPSPADLEEALLGRRNAISPAASSLTTPTR